MKATNAIAVGFVLSSFALLGTWAGTVGDVKTANTVGFGGDGGNHCPFEDQTSGMGGQSGECHFVCEGGVATLSVSADDPDSWASGSASCLGEGILHCSDQGSCSDDTATTSSGDGRCSGDTDETWDSGIYVNCSSRPDDLGGGDISDPTNPAKKCPVTWEPSPPYPRICVWQDGQRAASFVPLSACLIRDRTGSPLCETSRSPDQIIDGVSNMTSRILRTFKAENGSVSAHVFIGDDLVTGLVCWGFDCKQALPDFDVTVEGRTRWSVS